MRWDSTKLFLGVGTDPQLRRSHYLVVLDGFSFDFATLSVFVCWTLGLPLRAFCLDNSKFDLFNLLEFCLAKRLDNTCPPKVHIVSNAICFESIQIWISVKDSTLCSEWSLSFRESISWIVMSITIRRDVLPTSGTINQSVISWSAISSLMILDWFHQWVPRV